MRNLIFIFFITLLAGCANGFQQFYKPYPYTAKLKNVAWLKPGEEPKVYTTNDFSADIKSLRSKMYIPIGYSSFNGKLQGENYVKEEAKNIRATVVLVSRKYTNTVTTTAPLILPSSSTTYSSGSVYGSGGYANYNGSSTTYGSRIVPITSSQRRYDQAAIFFVRSTHKPRFGVQLKDLSEQQRQNLQRNTGTIVDVVVEDTPAFYANVLPGDVLIKVDGVDISNVKQAYNLLFHYDPKAKSASFTVLRNGETKVIPLKIKPE